MDYLIAENTRSICRVIATNVTKIRDRYLDHDEVAELGDRGVAITVLESDLIRDQDGIITQESKQWLQQLVSCYSSHSSSEPQQQEESSPKQERRRGSFDAGSVDNFLSKINRKRGNK